MISNLLRMTNLHSWANQNHLLVLLWQHQPIKLDFPLNSLDRRHQQLRLITFSKWSKLMLLTMVLVLEQAPVFHQTMIKALSLNLKEKAERTKRKELKLLSHSCQNRKARMMNQRLILIKTTIISVWTLFLNRLQRTVISQVIKVFKTNWANETLHKWCKQKKEEAVKTWTSILKWMLAVPY